MSGRTRLVVASLNPSKAREIAEVLSAAGLGFEVVGLSEFPEVELPPEVGETFAANAMAKAAHVARATGLAAIADDSGLEVEALDGAPGVRSARFAGEGAGDAGRYGKLLDLMREAPDDRRQARFRCAAAYATPGGETLLAEGECRGRIGRAPKGSGGFGYDPVFVPEGYECTMAELRPEEKHAISHRGRAFRALAEMIREQVGGKVPG